MLVLRIENALGGGPFNCPEAHGEARDLALAASMPSPWDGYHEPGLSRRWEKLGASRRPAYRFGFDSRRQLRQYFKPEITKALRLLGFRPVWYEVDEDKVIRGYTQVAFHNQYARRVR
jgi:hypothetical protein